MSAVTVDADRLAELVTAYHRRRPSGNCACGWVRAFTKGPKAVDQHPGHVAFVVREAMAGRL